MCNEIARLFRYRIKESSDNDELFASHGTRLVLALLAVKDGVTQLDIVNATRMRPPTISVILKNLEEQGIVERKKDPSDLRVLRVHLTKKGKALDKKSIEIIRQTDAIALDGLTEEEKETLMLLLAKIRDNLLREPTRYADAKEDDKTR